ncbi:hypothetical protein DA70_08760 [Pandoraea pnomenusa]|nr:hypothetical protein DA70_08760 [Pandoraea pnomenusa]
MFPRLNEVVVVAIEQSLKPLQRGATTAWPRVSVNAKSPSTFNVRNAQNSISRKSNARFLSLRETLWQTKLGPSKLASEWKLRDA